MMDRDLKELEIAARDRLMSCIDDATPIEEYIRHLYTRLELAEKKNADLFETLAFQERRGDKYLEKVIQLEKELLELQQINLNYTKREVNRIVRQHAGTIKSNRCKPF